MVKRQYTPGTFVRIRLQDQSYAYARFLDIPDVAFYDYRMAQPESDLDAIGAKPILFTVSVMTSTLGACENIGWRELEDPLTEPVVRFMQSAGDHRRCTIFDTAGNERPATPEECVGIERAAVWRRATSRNVYEIRSMVDPMRANSEREYIYCKLDWLPQEAVGRWWAPAARRSTTRATRSAV